MNEVLRRRLIGLAVLVFGLFLLSWFVPGGDGRGVEPGTPSALVPLAADGSVETPVQPAAASDELPVADASPAATAAPSAPPIADLGSSDNPAASEPARPASAAPVVPVAKPALKLAQAVEHPVEAHRPAPPAAKVEPARPATPKPAPAKAVDKPAPPAKPVASAKPASPSASGWWIQIGSYSDRGKAETILSLLRKVGHHGELTTIKGRKGLLNRVRLGPYANEAAARAALPKVAHQGYPQARVVSEPPLH